MIDRWTILHLRRRTDRAPYAFANAERIGVPREIVRFWDAKDNEDFGDNPIRVMEAAVEDGFQEFECLYDKIDVPAGKICQTWNVCRFLRDLSERDSEDIEMFIHDGIMIQRSVNEKTFFYPDFQYFCDVVEYLSKRRPKFKLLTVGTLMPLIEIKPLTPGSLILNGVCTTTNSVRVYSRTGAQHILKRILSEIKRGIWDADCYFNDMTTETVVSNCWSEPGMYTLMLQKIACDMQSDYFGSDSQGWGNGYRGVYKGLFQ